MIEFQDLLDPVFAIRALRTLSSWNDQTGYYVRFEFDLSRCCYGASKLIVDVVSDRNIVFRFTSHWLLDISRIESLERFLVRYEGWVKRWMKEGKHIKDQGSFIEKIRTPRWFPSPAISCLQNRPSIVRTG